MKKKEVCQKIGLIGSIEKDLEKKHPDRFAMDRCYKKMTKVLKEFQIPVPMQLGILELIKADIITFILESKKAFENADLADIEKILENQLRSGGK